MTGGADIWYSLNGGGSAVESDPPLVLIHGAGGSHLHWGPTTRRLSGRSVYAIDLPGHGHSPGEGSESIAEYAEAVSSWLRQIGLERPVVVGHSMGGAIALSLALNLPESLGGLVLVGTSDHLPVNSTLLGMLERDETYRDAIDLVIRWSFSPAAEPRLVELSRKRMLESPRSVIYGDFRACERYDVQGRLGEIRVPTLVICGAEDKMTPERNVRRLTQGISGSRFKIVQGAGHMVMLEKPSILDDAVQNFLAEEAL
jgi:pimeloyl-ACP methyl ester carboxylesterase